MEYLIVGKIVGTHGIKGEVKVKSDTSFKDERYKKGSILYLDFQNKKEQIKIDSHREHKNMDLITFNGYNNINDILKYVGCDVLVKKEDLKELEDGEYYYDDLIGLMAFETSGKKIGEVIDINEVPQGIILVIEKEDGKRALVPFVPYFIKDVDLEEEKIIIEPIEGLL